MARLRPGRLLGRLLARSYGAWCLGSIGDGAKRALETTRPAEAAR